MAVPGVGANAVALSKEFKTDTHGLVNALEMAQQWKVQRLSLASSQAVYRGIVAGPFREDMPLPVDSMSGTETYKKVWENVGQYFASGWGLDVIAIRIAGIYGPLFYHPAPFMAMSMVRATCTAAAQGGVQPEYGTIPGGTPYAEMGADLCYVQDCARGIQLLQHAPKDTLKHTVCNLGSGRKTTQGEVAAVVQQVVPRAQTPCSLASHRTRNGTPTWTSRACGSTWATSRSGRWTAPSLTTSSGCATTWSSRSQKRAHRFWKQRFPWPVVSEPTPHGGSGDVDHSALGLHCCHHPLHRVKRSRWISHRWARESG
jgi:nucleoside-diphosphate-sugar epimerase